MVLVEYIKLDVTFNAVHYLHVWLLGLKLAVVKNNGHFRTITKKLERAQRESLLLPFIFY